MPSDPKVSERLRSAVADRGFEERYFFGGVAFFLNGNFAVGVYHDSLALRLGEIAAESAMLEPGVGPMDITGRPMRGWVFAQAESFSTDAQLGDWVDQVFDFVSTLPVKTKATKPRRTKKSKPKK